MTAPRPIVAVVPFGSRAADPRGGAWARQIARRVVDRLTHEPALELLPVFLVAVPDDREQAGYLVLGSTPDSKLAASYATSLGATHALVGTYEEDGGRGVAVELVDAGGAQVARQRIALPAGELAKAEPLLARWLANALGVELNGDPDALPAASEAAYAALLEGMDEEINETVLRKSSAGQADEAAERARQRYLAAVEADPACTVALERLLVRAAESLEQGDLAPHLESLERLVEIDPRSWRAQYLLGELRAASGNTNGAIVALEHSHALRPLPDADVVRLAELYVASDALGPAGSHLRRIARDSAEYGRAQGLVGAIAAQRGDLAAATAAFERAIESGAADGTTYAAYATLLHGRGDISGAIARYREAVARGAPPAMRLGFARALVASDDRPAAAAELEALLRDEASGEAASHARRLLFGIQRPVLERDLEAAGRAAVEGDETRLAEAHAVFERVLAAEPDLWEAHFGAGLVARRGGDAEAAERAFRRVLELWPEQPDALHELGVALLMGERTNEAVRALERAASLRPGDAGYLADAGFAQLRAGNLSAARLRLERASGIDEQDPITRAYLAELARVEALAGRTN